ncbi:MAG: esterase-like activity of phytase family protein [Planctomycetota bacterium]|nr:esterase-like activity of phytase family protein [Planctomycetota bacterium]
MLDLRTNQILMIAALGGLFGACGGGSAGGPSPVAIFAGDDVAAFSRARVVLEAAAASGQEVPSFQWVQVGGPAVVLEAVPGGAAGAISFLAPDRDTDLEFVASGLSATGGTLGSDSVTVVVEAPRTEFEVEPLSTISLGAGHALASAYHEATAQAFVIDPVLGEVLVFDLSDPSEPILAGSIDGPSPAFGYVPGPPLAVDCGASGPVVVTWGAETIEFPGRVQFIDPVTLLPELAVSSFGSNPVGIDVTPDGLVVAVACAGDPPFVGGGEALGYVTIFRVPPGGPALINQGTDIAPIPFTAFDGEESVLEAEGVRWFNSVGTRASIELTPRAVALSPDGAQAWVACSENDALIVIDTVEELATKCLSLDDRAWGTFQAGAAVSGQRIEWGTPPTQVTTPSGDSVEVGGFSGIASAVEVGGGRIRATVIDGAGPALAPVDIDGDLSLELPMVDPDLQLRLRVVEIDPATGAVDLLSELPLTDGAGSAVVGRPSLFASSAGLAQEDEPTVDLSGAPVAPSDLGARFSGAAAIDSGGVWLADARRCGLWRFDAAGSLVQRFVPAGTPGSLGSGTLPAVYATRRANLSFDLGRRFGGFGALAHQEGPGLLTVATRLPLDNPDTADDLTSAGSAVIRLLQVDDTTGLPVGEYALVLDAPDHSIEGLCVSSSAAFGGLAVLEVAADPSGFRGVYSVDLSSATNLQSLDPVDYAAASSLLESTPPDQLGALPVPVVPVRKVLRANLADAGLGGSGRASGLAALGDDFVVTFDNGARLDVAASSPRTGALTGVGGPDSAFAVVQLEPEGLDAKSTPGAFEPKPLPVQGLSQPLDLLAYSDRGQVRLALANGGLARVLPPGEGAGFDEREAVQGLTLDTMTFPGALQLQQPDQAGDLMVSTVGNDPDGDGLTDRLLAFGARSIGLRDADGSEIWSSGQRLAARAAALDPAAQRANATMGGLRPIKLALGEVGGVPYLLAVMEGPGAVAAFDLANPVAPLFAGWLTGPQGAADVDAAGDLVVVTDPSLGQVRVLGLSRL